MEIKSKHLSKVKDPGILSLIYLSLGVLEKSLETDSYLKETGFLIRDYRYIGTRLIYKNCHIAERKSIGWVLLPKINKILFDICKDLGLYKYFNPERTFLRNFLNSIIQFSILHNWNSPTTFLDSIEPGDYIEIKTEERSYNVTVLRESIEMEFILTDENIILQLQDIVSWRKIYVRPK